MTTRTFKIAGWMTMASAFAALPLVYVSFRLEGMTDVTSITIQTFIQITGTLLAVAILLFLKRLLNSIFNFKDTDRNINLINMASVVTGVLSVSALFIPPLKESISPIVIAVLAVQGIMQAQLGYKLLKLPDHLGGMLKSFCYLNMATGIFLASVVLIPLGILSSALSDLMLGTIFLNMSRMAKDSVAKTEFE